MADAEFVNGLIVKAPKEGAPDFVKASISIKVADLGMWLREKHKAGEEWVNADIKISAGGKWYAQVYKGKPKAQESAKAPARGNTSHDDESDIPFSPIGRGIAGHAI